MTGLVALLLAHQGGWDEILLVLTPIALFAGLLWLANTRANKELQRRKAAASDDEADDTAAGDRDRDDT
jgi:cyanate permease